AVLDVAMAGRGFVLVAAVLFVFVSATLYAVVGLDFFPSVDAGLMRFHLRAPAGTRIEETERLVDAVEQRVRRIVPAAELETIDDDIGVPLFYNLGFVPSENASESDAEVVVGLKPSHHALSAYEDRIRREVREGFPGSTLYFEQADIVSQVLNFGLPAPVDIEVQAPRYQDAVPIALRLEQALQAIPGVRDVRLGQVLDHPSLQIDVDRDRAIQVGLTERDVASSVLTSLSSSALVSPNFWINPQNNVNYFVVVQTPYFHVSDVPTLMATPITPATPAPEASTAAGSYGAVVPLPAPPTTPIAPYLGGLAALRPTTVRSSIHHETVQPVLDVECGVQGRDLGAVARDIDSAVARLGKLPAGVSVRVTGQPETMFTAFGRLGLGMIVAVALVYLLLVVLFQSWIDPLLIMFAVPASLSGVLWMLAATGTTLNVESLMGAIMAVGIAASNSVLLVHFANDRRMEDGSVVAAEAAVFAGRTRLRPVLMTALAMILGMLPMALGLGEGGQQNAPLGRAVIGGLLVSTFATLVVIPCAYAVLRKRPPVMGRHDRAVAEADRPQGAPA
ncbi:MAG TPA: efflux RND transporter permease subunit, partial [Polyangiaceae bacterium]|nr:efflux RND transporter permease subunit [Polyangiaceae bacterium]